LPKRSAVCRVAVRLGKHVSRLLAERQTGQRVIPAARTNINFGINQPVTSFFLPVRRFLRTLKN